MLHEYQVNFKALRHERGWSQGELSKRSGVSRVTISRLESEDGYSPRRDTMKKLAAAFGMGAEEFTARLQPSNGLERLMHAVRNAEQSIVEAGIRAQHEEIDRLLKETNNPILQRIFSGLRQGVTDKGYVSPVTMATAQPVERVDTDEEKGRATNTPESTNQTLPERNL